MRDTCRRVLLLGGVFKAWWLLLKINIFLTNFINKASQVCQQIEFRLLCQHWNAKLQRYAVSHYSWLDCSVYTYTCTLQCTHVVEYARDTYSRTGSTLLDSIAIVHPFTISTLLNRATTPTGSIREVRKNACRIHLYIHVWLTNTVYYYYDECIHIKRA